MAIKQANGSLATYPAPPGDKPFCIKDFTGPVSYVAIVTGTPPTGGQKINATDLGMTSIEFAQVMGSDNGQFDGVIYFPMTTNGAQGASILIQWITAATGAEVGAGVNLSGRSFRLLVMGNN